MMRRTNYGIRSIITEQAKAPSTFKTYIHVTTRAFVWCFFLVHTIPLACAHAGIVVVDLGDRGSHNQQDHMTDVDFGWRLLFHNLAVAEHFAGNANKQPFG